MPAAPVSTQRKAPTQQRSRARVDRMLEVAVARIALHGSDALRMSDVAADAGVSIGSLYQYFPDKGALVRTLAERYNAEGRACVLAILAGVQNARDLDHALLATLDGYYAMFRQEPAMLAIWSATQADKALLDLDAQDGRAHGAMLAELLLRLAPKASKARRAEIAGEAYLTMHLIAATVRLAVTLDRTAGDALINTFKRLRPWGKLLKI